MSSINSNYDMKRFYSVFDNISNIDPKNDLITTSLDQKLNLLEQLIERIKKIFTNTTKLNNVNLKQVSEELLNFIQIHSNFLKNNCENENISNQKQYSSFVNNIRLLAQRVHNKYDNQPCYSADQETIVNNIDECLKKLEAIRPFI